MTTADRSPHPWAAQGSRTLVDPNPTVVPRRAPSQPSAESVDATKARMTLDDHRSQDGQCVRCQTQWPCEVTASIRFGGTA
ncbi:hypothetical protein P3T36_004873 [Kitasatospora sp. MAP12-15]|uniref:hypothetical protein n=1 Tax=unclassified Kitasatospora TaxID=2633591 RepID=UPI00247442AB|nr:hypothetical protein [Kitasatospora sp. MAP12-44]MDH6110195.1 hypothetical protein [Kitasatospora sp. MAP12-44]